MKLKDISQLSPVVNECLQPLKDCIEKIEQDSEEKSKYFEDFKRNILINGEGINMIITENNLKKLHWKRRK